jgi:hypothetical protein
MEFLRLQDMHIRDTLIIFDDDGIFLVQSICRDLSPCIISTWQSLIGKNVEFVISLDVI